MGKVYLSQQANQILKNHLKSTGYEIQEIGPTAFVYPAISSHPDIYMCKLGTSPSAPVFHGQAQRLGTVYPQTVGYNAACIGPYFIHNLKHTDPELLQAATAMKLQCIDVKQGYTKCNLVTVGSRAAITADSGLIKTLSTLTNPALRLLQIAPGHVKLAGFPYGFLGGASGQVGNQLIFNGNLSAHPNFSAIKRFVEAEGLQLIYFKEYPLEDIGSIYEETCDYTHFYTP